MGDHTEFDVFSVKKNPLTGQTELDIVFSAKKPSHIMNG